MTDTTYGSWNIDVSQPCARLEHSRAHALHRLRQRHTTQVLALREQIVTHCHRLTTGLESHLRYHVAAHECSGTDRCHARGEIDIGQRRTTTERLIPNGLYPFWNRHRCQVRTHIKCLVPNTLHRTGNGCRNHVRFVKCSISNACNPVRNIHTQRLALVKGIRPNVGYAILNHDGRDRIIVGIPRRKVLRRKIWNRSTAGNRQHARFCQRPTETSFRPVLNYRIRLSIIRRNVIHRIPCHKEICGHNLRFTHCPAPVDGLVIVSLGNRDAYRTLL